MLAGLQYGYMAKPQEIIFRQHKRSLLVLLIVDIFVFIWIFGLGLLLALYHWLRYQNNGITLKEKVVVLQRGGLSTSTTEVPYAKVNSVTVNQGVVGKSWNYGDIIISTGNDVAGVTFKGIANPHRLKELIQERT